MSAVKTFFAGGALIAVVSAIPGVFITDDPPSLPPAPITIHALTMDMDAWSVHQHRTVEAYPESDAPIVPMEWAARIEVYGGEPVRDCTGSGVWPYTVGGRNVPIPADEWVGHIGVCSIDDLMPGVAYQLVASWWTVDGNTVPVTARSEPFTVPGVSE